MNLSRTYDVIPDKGVMVTVFDDLFLVEHLCYAQNGEHSFGPKPELFLLAPIPGADVFGARIERAISDSGQTVSDEDMDRHRRSVFSQRYALSGRNGERAYFGDSISVFIRRESDKYSFYSYVPNKSKRGHVCNKSGWRTAVPIQGTSSRLLGEETLRMISNILADPR